MTAAASTKVGEVTRKPRSFILAIAKQYILALEHKGGGKSQPLCFPNFSFDAYTEEEYAKVTGILNDLKLHKCDDIVLINAIDNKPSASTVG